MMNLLWISIAMYTGASGGQYHGYFQWLGFALATPTLFYAGYPFLKNAYFGVKNRYMNMDVPISIGALTTYFYSVYVLLGFSAKGEVYFDTVVNFIFVILIGRYLEASSKNLLYQLPPVCNNYSPILHWLRQMKVNSSNPLALLRLAILS
jgi:Cation transport ATPase